jgi:hypothetical protein
LDGGAEHLAVEQAGGGEGLVADGFGGEADARTSGDQAIEGVFGELVGGGGGGLAVGGGGDYLFEEGLGVPVEADVFGGEVVEEVGVGGEFAL